MTFLPLVFPDLTILGQLAVEQTRSSQCKNALNLVYLISGDLLLARKNVRAEAGFDQQIERKGKGNGQHQGTAVFTLAKFSTTTPTR